VELGFARWQLRDANIGGAALGGLLFGVGMAIYGCCPGTGLAAAAYAQAFDAMRGSVLARSNLGRVTLADVTGLPLWALYVALVVVALALFVALERWQGCARA
jgi:hypothetical protein